MRIQQFLLIKKSARTFPLLLMFILLVVFFIPFSQSSSQPQITPPGQYDIQTEIEWIRTYNGEANGLDKAEAIGIDGEGNVYVTGMSRGPGDEIQAGNYDIVTIKYDNTGKEQWVNRWNNPAFDLDDVPSSLVVDGRGNVYVTGKSLLGDREFFIVTISYNTHGEKLWEDLYYGGFSLSLAYPEKIVLDNDGHVYVVGTVEGDTSLDICTIKYTVNGDRLWVRLFNGEDNDNDIAQDIAVHQGYVVVVGETMTSHLWTNYVTIKYTDEGNLLWVRMYNYANFNDGAYAVAIDAVGNIYVTGQSHSEIAFFAYDYATIKYSPEGDILWINRYDGTPEDSDDLWIDCASDILLHPDGTVVVTGKSTHWSGPEGLPTYYATVCYHADGRLLWEDKYYVYRGEPPVLAVDFLGNIYLVGSKAGGPTTHDFFTISYSSRGTIRWVEEYNGPGNCWDKGADIAVDRQGNVYVTGFSTGIGTDYDFTTIKYNQRKTPYIPYNPKPGNNSLHVPLIITLSWIGGHPDIQEDVTYDVYFGTTNPPPKIGRNHLSTTYTLDILQPNTTYYWRIVSWSTNGLSSSGPLWQFKTVLYDLSPAITVTSFF